MWDKLDFDTIRQQIPFFIYKQILLEYYNRKYYFNPEIPIGYNFLLREVMYKSNYKAIEPPASPKSSIRIEFIRSLRGRELQNVPFPLSLISTPGTSDAVASLPPASPAPPPPPFSGVLFTALPQVKNNLIINYLYQHRETIELRIQHVTSPPDPGRYTFYIDILLSGYFLPERMLEMWKSKEVKK